MRRSYKRKHDGGRDRPYLTREPHAITFSHTLRPVELLELGGTSDGTSVVGSQYAWELTVRYTTCCVIKVL